MRQLEELRFSFEQSTKGDWDTIRHGTPDYAPQYGVYAGDSPSDLAIVFREADGDFMCMAHNLMPQLLEAVELIEDVATGNSEYDDLSDRAAELLEKLK